MTEDKQENWVLLVHLEGASIGKTEAVLANRIKNNRKLDFNTCSFDKTKKYLLIDDCNEGKTTKVQVLNLENSKAKILKKLEDMAKGKIKVRRPPANTLDTEESEMEINNKTIKNKTGRDLITGKTSKEKKELDFRKLFNSKKSVILSKQKDLQSKSTTQETSKATGGLGQKPLRKRTIIDSETEDEDGSIFRSKSAKNPKHAEDVLQNTDQSFASNSASNAQDTTLPSTTPAPPKKNPKLGEYQLGLDSDRILKKKDELLAHNNKLQATIEKLTATLSDLKKEKKKLEKKYSKLKTDFEEFREEAKKEKEICTGYLLEGLDFLKELSVGRHNEHWRIKSVTHILSTVWISVHIGNGLYLTEAQNSNLLADSATPAQFVGNILVTMFGTDLLEKSSRTGNISNKSIGKLKKSTDKNDKPEKADDDAHSKDKEKNTNQSADSNKFLKENKKGKNSQSPGDGEVPDGFEKLDSTKLLACEEYYLYWLEFCYEPKLTKKATAKYEREAEFSKFKNYVTKKISNIKRPPATPKTNKEKKRKESEDESQMLDKDKNRLENDEVDDFSVDERAENSEKQAFVEKNFSKNDGTDEDKRNNINVDNVSEPSSAQSTPQKGDSYAKVNVPSLIFKGFNPISSSDSDSDVNPSDLNTDSENDMEEDPLKI